MLNHGEATIPLGSHVLDFNTSDSSFLGNSLRIFNSGILDFVLLHLFMHDRLGLLYDLLQEYNCTLSGAHAMNQTEVNVFKVVSPGILQELENFEKLGCMKILCRGDDVNHLVEFILVVSLYGARNVTSEVDGGTV